MHWRRAIVIYMEGAAMATQRGKRPGLRARSKNARTLKAVAAAVPPPHMMFFREVELGAPREGALLLVRLNDGTFRFGMNLRGRFANYEYHNEEFVTFAFPQRITHWMEVVSPIPFVGRGDDTSVDYVVPFQSIERAAIAAAQEDVNL